MDFKKAKKTIDEGVNDINEDDLSDLLNKENRLFSMLTGVLSSVADDVKTMFSLAKDYSCGYYRDIRWERLSIIIFALLYLLMPFDLIPDFIPVIGFVDDIAVISVSLKMVSDELKEYKKWLEEN